jgi:hypothetical protein
VRPPVQLELAACLEDDLGEPVAVLGGAWTCVGVGAVLEL